MLIEKYFGGALSSWEGRSDLKRSLHLGKELARMVSCMPWRELGVIAVGCIPIPKPKAAKANKEITMAPVGNRITFNQVRGLLYIVTATSISCLVRRGAHKCSALECIWV